MAVQETFLYDGKVKLEFNEGNHRYKVFDEENGVADYRPGVTSILNILDKPALKGWAAYMAAKSFREAVARAVAEGTPITDLWLENAAKTASDAHMTYSDKAKDVGHVIHAIIEQYLKGKMDAGYTPDYSMMDNLSEADKQLGRTLYLEFQKWYESSGLTCIGSEQTLYSRQYQYCGTFDCLFETPQGGIILGDVKTTKRTVNAQNGIYDEYVAQLGAYAQAWEEEHPGQRVADLMILNPDKVFGQMVTGRLSDYGISVEQAKALFVSIHGTAEAIKPMAFKLKDQNKLKKQAWYAYAKGNKI